MDHSQIIPETTLITGSGLGAVPLGLRDVVQNFEPGLYVEWDAFPALLLVSHMENGDLPPAPLWVSASPPPLSALPERIRGHVGSFRPYPDLLPSFFPKAEWLFFEFHPSTLGPLSPRFSYSPNAPIIPYLSALQRMGYDVEAGLFSAAESGASIRRPSFYVFAMLAGYVPPRLHVPQWASVPLLRSPQSCEPVAYPRGPSRSFAPPPLHHFLWPAYPVYPQIQIQPSWEHDRIFEPGMGRATHGIPAALDRSRSRFVKERLHSLSEASVPSQVSHAFFTLYTQYGEHHPCNETSTTVKSPDADNSPTSPSTDDLFALLIGKDIAPAAPSMT